MCRRGGEEAGLMAETFCCLLIVNMLENSSNNPDDVQEQV
jgi:hypothetical protein